MSTVKKDIATGLAVHNIHEAKTHLSRLVDEVAEVGVSIIIAKAGRPMVKIVPLDAPTKGKRRGFLAGLGFTFDAAAFTAMDSEIVDLFEGKE
ncbi:MAG: type II toxin-antitoxin system prevent-host-death family antitoxin [Pseudomonas sp.]|uniref:type II toxin-antitoxin system Phd/YefM family antitoxin n=1 Tax=Pseudomonas sp. TaxID=306 RepID=UPI0030F2A42C